MGLGALGKDIQNDGCSIQHLHIEQLLEIAQLGRREFVVHDNQVVFEGLLERNHLFDLAFAQIRSGHRVSETLGD